MEATVTSAASLAAAAASAASAAAAAAAASDPLANFQSIQGLDSHEVMNQVLNQYFESDGKLSYLFNIN